MGFCLLICFCFCFSIILQTEDSYFDLCLQAMVKKKEERTGSSFTSVDLWMQVNCFFVTVLIFEQDINLNAFFSRLD